MNLLNIFKKKVSPILVFHKDVWMKLKEDRMENYQLRGFKNPADMYYSPIEGSYNGVFIKANDDVYNYDNYFYAYFCDIEII